MSTDFTKLPIIDLSILGKTNATEEELKSLAKEVRKICETVGFAYLINYESSVKHSKIFEVVKRFFDLPISSKMKVAKKTFVPSNQNTYRGYFPLQKGDSSYKEG
jgi:isopenicillin N synthase-like dioxygenase